MKKITLAKDKIYWGELILVNRAYPYRESRSDKTLVSIEIAAEKKVCMERQPAALYGRLIETIRAWKQITAVSGWRSLREQEQIYDNSLIQNGVEFTAKYVALPGHSEHQTGFAVDLALNRPDIDMLCPDFPYTGICGSLRKMAGQYGFIERYPKGKEYLTGISHEPWHFRYVGAPHSLIMEQTGETLEEYHARLKQYNYGNKPLKKDFGGLEIEISYLAAEKEITTFKIEDNIPFSVSGNNMDGFIITVWRA